MTNPPTESADATWPWYWAVALSFIVFLQSCVMLYSTPLGIPPDEIAHLSYIRDVADGGLLPDYASGRIRESSQPNYLAHPPLYYTLLGKGSAIIGIDPFVDYKLLRLVGALAVWCGFGLWLLVARTLGIGLHVATLVTLATCATPMFAFLAGSVNNDSLLYFGASLFFYGASREYLAGRAGRHARLAMFAGLVVTFLTKATASAFIVFFAAACLLPVVKRLPSLLRQHRGIAFGAAAVFICSVYFVYARLRFGAFMPAPGRLYAEIAPQQPLVPVEFALHYAMAMWQRLPIILSGATFDPFVPGSRPFFQAMVCIPLLGWLLARPGAVHREVTSETARAIDAFAIALAAMILLHFMIAYAGYRTTGIFAGLQPRYFAFLLPALWLPAFALERRLLPRKLLLAAFMGCAAIAFWGSVPFFIGKQAAMIEAMRVSATRAPQPPSKTLQGHLDELTSSAQEITVRGWAFDGRTSKQMSRIVVMRAGALLGSSSQSVPRPDVAKALANAAAGSSGFHFDVAEVPPGTRLCEIEVAAEARDGERVWLRRRTCE